MILWFALRLLVFAWWLGPEPDERGPRTLGPAFASLARRLWAGRNRP